MFTTRKIMTYSYNETSSISENIYYSYNSDHSHKLSVELKKKQKPALKQFTEHIQYDSISINFKTFKILKYCLEIHICNKTVVLKDKGNDKHNSEQCLFYLCGERGCGQEGASRQLPHHCNALLLRLSQAQRCNSHRFLNSLRVYICVCVYVYMYVHRKCCMHEIIQDKRGKKRNKQS